MNRHYGRPYAAVSIWDNPDEARAAAKDIRAQGALARVTQERRPLRSYGLPRYARGGIDMFRRPANARYMWVVWSEIPAHADNSEEGAAS